MTPKTSDENTDNIMARMKFRILKEVRKLTLNQAYQIFLILFGSGFLVLTSYIILMYGTTEERHELFLNSDFFINISAVLVFLLGIEFTLLGGFSKNSKKSRISKIFLVPFVGVVMTLFWAAFQFFTLTGAAIYAIFHGLILAYCGFAGINLFNQTPKDMHKQSFTIIERLAFPALTAGIFIFIVLNIDSQGEILLEGGLVFIVILLSLVIVTLLNYKQISRVGFKKLVLQFFLVGLLLFLWFFFITFPFLISYEGSPNFDASAVPFDAGTLFAFTLVTLVFGTFYLWDNILYQINRARHSTLQTHLPSQIQTSTAIQQSSQLGDNDKNISGNPDFNPNNQVICPNCNTLLEQDAIRELKIKKTVFCALCGDQISFSDIYGDEKEAVIREHNQLLEKFTKLPPIKVDRSEE